MTPLTPSFSVALAILTGAALACSPAASVGGAAAETGSSGAGGAAMPGTAVDVPPLVRRNLGITFTTVEVRDVARTLRVAGAFELEPLARREYRMALPGNVEILVDQYDAVAAGDPLFRFRSPAWPELVHEILAAEQAAATARAEVGVARSRLDEASARRAALSERLAALAGAAFRRADLESDAAALDATLPRLEAELRLADTRLENARRSREHALARASAAAGLTAEELSRESGSGGLPRYASLEWIEVRAQRGGVVEHLAVSDGAFVEPPGAVLSTVDPTRVRFRALALQGDLPRLAGVAEARIVPPRAPGRPVGGGVDASLEIGLEAHPEERTVALLARPRSGADWIRPGVSALLEVRIGGTGTPALAVPRASVVRAGLHHVLFRRDPRDPDRVLRVEADMGASDGRWVVLESGVARGDEVVVDGVYELELELQRRGGVRQDAHVHADGTTHADH